MSVDIEGFYQRYAPMVLRRCRALLRHDAKAQDAMQDVFVALLRHQDRLQDEAPSALLLRVATNVCLNRLRTERRFHELWTNADKPNHDLALHVLKGRHTWLEAGIIDASFGDGPMVPSVESDKGIPAGTVNTMAEAFTRAGWVNFQRSISMTWPSG